MRRHFAYLRYVLRHKWYVAVAGWQVGAPLVQLVFHDWSKFLSSEWIPYASTFYKQDGSSQYVESSAFAVAWNAHQKRNKHHWQYWILREDDGNTIALPIPSNHLLEMVADWAGAGRAITGAWTVAEWYEKNNHRIVLHDDSRRAVEMALRKITVKLG